jgi:predicted SprT family Zn-dependent metalloprotease
MTSVSIELKQRVKQRIIDCKAIADKRYNIDFKMPTIDYSLRGRVGGQADYRGWVIRVNAVLLNENVEEYIKQVIGHEVAHLINHQVHPQAHDRVNGKRSPHGYEWQSVMRALGLKPDRCHSMDTTNSRVNKTPRAGVFTLVCMNCPREYNVKAKTLMQWRAKPAAIRCRCSAGVNLKLKGEPTKLAPVPVFKPVTPAPTVTVKPAQVGTKMEQCERIYKMNRNATRAALIAVFIRDAGCTAAGASTYHATLKKKFG